MANISIARGNILKKIPIQGELFYDYQTESVYIGTGTTANDWKRIGGFDSLVLKGLLPSTVITVTALNEYAHKKAVVTTDEGYDGLKAGDAYIITKDFTDKNWKSGDLVIWTGDISATTDAITMETASELISEGWFYINCGLVAASLEGSFTNSTRTADVDMTKTPVATKNANGEATTITHATDAMTAQQMLDWLHETKADLQSDGKIPLSQVPAPFLDDTVIDCGEWL